VSSTADSAASTGEVAGMRAQAPSFACARTCPCLSAPVPTLLPGHVRLVFDRAHLGLVACACPRSSAPMPTPPPGCVHLAFTCARLGLFVLGACPHCLVALA